MDLFLRTSVQMNAFYFRPLWMASIIPPDMILILLEGITAIIHYCLLDPTTQYLQVRLHKYFTFQKRLWDTSPHLKASVSDNMFFPPTLIALGQCRPQTLVWSPQRNPLNPSYDHVLCDIALEHTASGWFFGKDDCCCICFCYHY